MAQMKTKVLSEGARIFGEGYFQFNRLSLIEILEGFRKDTMKKPLVTYAESEMDKRTEEALYILRDQQQSDFVYLDEDDFRVLGLDRHLQKIGNIKKMLKERKNGKRI